MIDADDEARRLQAEITNFEGREEIHRHGPLFHWRLSRVLRPALLRAFGHYDIYAVYAEAIAGAVLRTGLDTVLSLGCGDGVQEIRILRRAEELGLPAFRIIGFELAPGVVARANALADAEGLRHRFEARACDLNARLPHEERVAAVMAHHALHHLVGLERLFDSLLARLPSEGILVTFDMIGRNGHRRWPEVQDFLDKVWALLPEERRYDHLFRRATPAFEDWDCAIDGFEGVRAQDILPLLAQGFIPERFIAWGAFTELFTSARFGPNFDLTQDEDLAFLEGMIGLEQRFLAERRTTPTEMAAIFRPRSSAMVPDATTAEAFQRAIRLPGEVFPELPLEPFVSPYPPVVPIEIPCFGIGTRIAPVAGSHAARALWQGWSEPESHGAWALLDRQRLRFATEAPARTVALRIWNPLPSARGARITATAVGCAPADSGPLEQGELRELTLRAEHPRSVWEIELHSAAYRLPYLDGGPDKRPLAYRLVDVLPEA
ncbi:MAG: class I SAM-dependent methyltransferase [Rhodovarius sp.]|nr:class I SAM-dependent methyltransferase [Rhodovarius sp.]MDW8315191.1 class I SAM-dependent methyltransferase [Rhodovarius sp.]